MANYLTVLKDGQIFSRVALKKTGPMSIGQSEENEIRIDDPELTVCPRHAKISFHEGRYWIKNDQGRNGTLINGSFVNDWQPIHSSDVIVIGRFLLLYTDDEEMPRDPTVLKPIEQSMATIDRLLKDTVTRQPTNSPEMVQLDFHEGRSVFVLRRIISIGRLEHNALCLDDDTIDDAHALIYKNASHWFIRDLDSTNGIMVDSQFVHGEHKLHQRQTIQLGRIQFCCNIHSPCSKEQLTH